MKQYDLYLFDFDGTLVDTYESLTYVFGGSFEAVGVKISPNDVPQLMRSSLRAGYDTMGAPSDDESYKEYVSMIIKLLDDEESIRLSKAYEEVKKVLHELKEKGAKLGIVTSNNKKHVMQVINHLDLGDHLFDVIIGNGEAKRTKPNPDPVLAALEALNFEKDRVCYVGDALDDMRCGASAGVSPILVDRYNEYPNEDYLKIKTLDELLK